MVSEKRLIDANAYPCQNCEISYCYKNCEKFNAWFNKTVDAVEVVRCKDCMHYVLHALACRHENFNGVMNMNGFCFYGERKDNEVL